MTTEVVPADIAEISAISQARADAVGAAGLVVDRIVMIPATNLVPGLLLTCEERDTAGELVEVEPLRVVGIVDEGPVLLVSFDAWPHLMRFERDEQVAMVVMKSEPSWCVSCDSEGDGTWYHNAGWREFVFETPADPQSQRRTKKVSVTAARFDDPDGTLGETSVSIVLDDLRDSVDMSPADARRLAGLLVDMADTAEPVSSVPAEAVRLGDRIQTADVWETVTGLMHDGACQQVALYTVCDDEDALRVPLGTIVEIWRETGR